MCYFSKGKFENVLSIVAINTRFLWSEIPLVENFYNDPPRKRQFKYFVLQPPKEDILSIRDRMAQFHIYSFKTVLFSEVFLSLYK